jgi:hypothetical protein
MYRTSGAKNNAALRRVRARRDGPHPSHPPDVARAAAPSPGGGHPVDRVQRACAGVGKRMATEARAARRRLIVRSERSADLPPLPERHRFGQRRERPRVSGVATQPRLQQRLAAASRSLPASRWCALPSDSGRSPSRLSPSRISSPPVVGAVVELRAGGDESVGQGANFSAAWVRCSSASLSEAALPTRGRTALEAPRVPRSSSTTRAAARPVAALRAAIAVAAVAPRAEEEDLAASPPPRG